LVASFLTKKVIIAIRIAIEAAAQVIQESKTGSTIK